MPRLGMEECQELHCPFNESEFRDRPDIARYLLLMASAKKLVKGNKMG